MFNKEKVFQAQLYHTTEMLQHGTKPLLLKSTNKYANSPKRDTLHLKLVLFFVIPLVFHKLKELPETLYYVY